MATTPPLSPSIAVAKASLVEDWIQQLSEPASAHTDAFSPPSTPENRPSRDKIAVLASASPPTITEPSPGLKASPPRRVRDVMERLEDGLDRGWIPGWLREPIEDQDFGYQRIERYAWGESTARSF